MQALMQARREMELDLRIAIAERQFALYFQPFEPEAGAHQRLRSAVALAASGARNYFAFF